MANRLAIAQAADDRIKQAGQDFVAVPWHIFVEWFAAVWEPGQHVALIGPTGEGKSTFAVGILQARKYVIALDAKGGDSTLAASGFESIYKWPLTAKHFDRLADGDPLRLIASGHVRTEEALIALRTLMRDVVQGVRQMGGWTLYCDEFQILADRRMFGLDKEVETLLVAARSAGTSVLTAFQATAWVPTAARRQATFIVVWPTRDVNVIKAIAESMGRDWRQLQAAVHELPPYHVIVIPKKLSAPMIITTAPPVN